MQVRGVDSAFGPPAWARAAATHLTPPPAPCHSGPANQGPPPRKSPANRDSPPDVSLPVGTRRPASALPRPAILSSLLAERIDRSRLSRAPMLSAADGWDPARRCPSLGTRSPSCAALTPDSWSLLDLGPRTGGAERGFRVQC